MNRTSPDFLKKQKKQKLIWKTTVEAMAKSNSILIEYLFDLKV